MLHNAKFETKDDGMSVKASLHLNRAHAGSFDLGGATVSVTEADGGKNPGPDVELTVTVHIPQKEKSAKLKRAS